MDRVYISEKFSLTFEQAKNAIAEGCQRLGGLDRLLAGKRHILVKPNFAVSRNPEKAITNPIIIEAVLALLNEHGIKHMTVGEGCGGGASADPVFEVTGLRDIASRYGAVLVDLNNSEQVELPVPSGLLLKTVNVAREAAECDLIINVPTLKTHISTLISIAMKNLKGVLNWPTKRRFHQQGLFRSVVDLSRVLTQQLVVVDGTRGMEGWGPFDGDLVPVNRVVMAEAALAADIVCTRIMGFDFHEVPTIRLALEAGLGSEEPVVVGASIEAVKESIGRPFNPPPSGDVINLRFANVYFGDNICTGCQGLVHIVCKILEDLPEMPKKNRVDFYAGNRQPALPRPERVTVIFGSCAVKEARRAGIKESEVCLFVPGCPPDPGIMHETLGKLPAVLGN